MTTASLQDQLRRIAVYTPPESSAVIERAAGAIDHLTELYTVFLSHVPPPLPPGVHGDYADRFKVGLFDRLRVSLYAADPAATEEALTHVIVETLREGRRIALGDALEVARAAARPDPDGFRWNHDPRLKDTPEPGALKVVAAVETMVAKEGAG